MLSNHIEDIKPEYDVIVIGSGYGGGVSASRLSRAGYNVCVLERGREFAAGDFPNEMDEMLRETQYHSEHGQAGSRTALFDIRMFEETSVVVGCGLGGTSLINANVSLRLDPRVFEDPAWPKSFVEDLDTLSDCYNVAESMLRPTPLPTQYEHLKKYQAHKKSGAALKSTAEFAHAEFYSPPINVNFEDKINHVGVAQKACNLCGDCVSGCNHTAKNTTAMNYLPDAVNHGAEIFCETRVKYIEKSPSGWLVHFQTPYLGREAFKSPTQHIKAKKIIVAAGTIGSNEIMLRSREKGLQVSSQLGKHYSGNGDVLAFAYNTDQEINGIGSGDKDPQYTGLVGPCITSIIDCRKAENVNEGFVLEEGSIPGGISSILPAAFAGASNFFGTDTDSGIKDKIQEEYRKTLSLLRGPYTGAVDYTQTFLVMCHDDSSGELSLDDDHIKLSWPGVGEQPILEKVESAMTLAAKALGGTFMKNPITNKFMKNNQVSVHPLGGCCMGNSAEDGVVNHKGQVFSSGMEVHEGLYISDGSVLPKSVGVNPLLTISAVTERMCRYIVHEDKNAEIPLNFPHDGQSIEESGKALGIRFTEKMAGFFSFGDHDYKTASNKGKTLGSKGEFEFVLTIISRDVEEMIANPEHKANMFGTVIAPQLSEHPLAATLGSFQLFVDDPNDKNTRYMRYNMTLSSEEGKTYLFEGHKVVRDDPGFDIWADTTTLFITLTDDQKNLVGRGILKIDPLDFMKQMTTIKAVNGKNIKERMKATLKFSQFFAKKLYATYI